MPRRTRRPMRTLAVGALTAALLSTGACATPVHGGASASSSSATPIATTPGDRVAQSVGVASLLGPHPTMRAAGGAMFAAPAGVTIPPALMAAAPTAIAGVRGMDPSASKNPPLVIVAATAAQYQHFTKSPPGDQLGTTMTSSQGLPVIVLAPRTVASPASAMAKETLTHETFHALTLEHLLVNRPLWLAEGWAEYVGQRTVPQAPHRRADIHPHLPSDDELRGPNGPDAYYVAFTFARYLRAAYGPDKTMAFYTDAMTTRTGLDQLATARLGKTTSQLDAGYRAWYPTFH